jgi:broad specificity phosphatase PhoE
MKLTLLRHGETKENVEHIIQGQLPGQLTDAGRQQAVQAAQTLKDEQFDAVYCSDLRRCLDTAQPIMQYHSGTLFITDTLLRERMGGSFEGKPATGEHADFNRPDWYTSRMPGGGESWEDTRLRQIPLLNRLLDEYPNGSLLIITHGGPLRGIRALLEQRTLADIDTEETPNAGIWRVTMTQTIKINE